MIDRARSALAQVSADAPLRARWMVVARAFADATTAPIGDLHFAREGDLDPRYRYCPECQHEWPCPTAQAVAAIREAVRA